MVAMSASASFMRTRLYRKIDLRVLSILFVCYAFSYVDRINIGFAKLQMQRDLGFSDAVYGLGAGIFFLGYVLFEIPSNLLLTKIGARRTFARILFLWGATSAAMLFVREAHLFYILRFMLGVFEAGFAPGMIFYLTLWYSEARRARAIAIVLCAAPIGGMFGGPFSSWIMTSLSGAHGIAGWQWMFLFEGVPAILLGILAFCCLDDSPREARWLSVDEKALLETDLQSNAPTSHDSKSLLQIIADPRIYRLAATYFCLICGLYAVGFWLPTILKESGLSSLMEIGFYSAIPYLAAIIGMYALAQRSDALQERRWHSVLAALLAAVALTVAGFSTTHFVAALISITIATAAMYASYTVFWAIPMGYLKGPGAAGGIALINSIGLLGGFLSPTVIGWAKTMTGSIQAGLFIMVGLLVAGAILLMMERVVVSEEGISPSQQPSL